MNKWSVCILRVSTNKQETRLQHHALREELARRKLVPVELETVLQDVPLWSAKENIVVMVEDVCTGRSVHRKGYLWALGEVKGGRVKSVLCYRADRLGRSVQNNAEFANACIARDTELFSLKDNFDLGTPAGRLLFNIVSSAAQYESELISERTKNGIAAKREEATAKGEEYHHGGTAKGWWHKRVIKLLPRVYEMLDMDFSMHHIRRVTGLNYRTIRKIKAERGNEILNRKQLNERIYGKSDAVI